MLAADLIAKMVPAASLFFADRHTFEHIMRFLTALYFSRLRAADTSLVHCYFTSGAKTLVAASGADVSAF